MTKQTKPEKVKAKEGMDRMKELTRRVLSVSKEDIDRQETELKREDGHSGGLVPAS